MSVISWHRQACPHLELKTRLRFYPDDLSLSMYEPDTSLIFASKAGSYQSRLPYGAPL